MSGIEELDRIPSAQAQAAPQNEIDEEAMDIDEPPRTNIVSFSLFLFIYFFDRFFS